MRYPSRECVSILEHSDARELTSVLPATKLTLQRSSRPTPATRKTRTAWAVYIDYDTDVYSVAPGVSDYLERNSLARVTLVKVAQHVSCSRIGDQTDRLAQLLRFRGELTRKGGARDCRSMNHKCQPAQY